MSVFKLFSVFSGNVKKPKMEAENENKEYELNTKQVINVSLAWSKHSFGGLTRDSAVPFEFSTHLYACSFLLVSSLLVFPMPLLKNSATHPEFKVA